MDSQFNVIDKPILESSKWTLACSVADIDQNGKNDILAVNDMGDDELFLQLNQNEFTDKAVEWQMNDNSSGMNSTIFDF